MRRALSVAALTVSASALAAQGNPPIPDSTRAAPRVALAVRDTIKAPFPVADAGSAPAHGRVWHWQGDEIFQSGATSLAELLELIPGVRVLRSGFILAPHVLTWLSDPGRVRVFVDGVELDALDHRAGLARDVAAIPIWHLEDVLAEAAPGELRVHLRTWRVQRTTAATRVDVLTGDAETNAYRGYFGRRFQSGFGLQFGFQQMGFSTRDRGGDGDGLSLFGRAGIARERWAVDIVSQRVGVTRNATLRQDIPGSVPAFTGRNSMSYLRLALGSPDRGRAWAQLIASGLSFEEATPPSRLSSAFGEMPADSADTSAFRAQYVATAGVRQDALSMSAGVRYRRMNGEGSLAPHLRVGWARPWLTVSGFAERSGADSTLRTDASARVSPLTWLALSASASRRTPIDDHPQKAATIVRAEAELRAFGAHVTAGVVSRDSTRTTGIPVFAGGIIDTVASAASGLTYAVRVPVYRALVAEVSGTRWESIDVYRPVDEVRARIGIDTEWRSRFPRGDFTVRASGTMHNFSRWLVPVEGGVVRMPGARVYSTLLEIRIKTATIAWEFRNAAGARYETVPGYEMPRIVNLYGVRWRFTN